eukprot:4416902-Amphidinium_carterae.3
MSEQTVYFVVGELCVRCREEPEDLSHILYPCPHWHKERRQVELPEDDDETLARLQRCSQSRPSLANQTTNFQSAKPGFRKTSSQCFFSPWGLVSEPDGTATSKIVNDQKTNQGSGYLPNLRPTSQRYQSEYGCFWKRLSRLDLTSVL